MIFCACYRLKYVEEELAKRKGISAAEESVDER